VSIESAPPEHENGGPGRLLPVSPKRQAEFRAQRKGILFFLKRFGLFPFVRSEHNPTSTKNENKKYDSSMLKKVNRPREQKEIYEPAYT